MGPRRGFTTVVTLNERDRDTLHRLRTHTMVAMLAIGLLLRKFLIGHEERRLGNHALGALKQLRDDLRRLDDLIARMEDREQMWDDPLRLRPWTTRERECPEEQQ